MAEVEPRWYQKETYLALRKAENEMGVLRAELASLESRIKDKDSEIKVLQNEAREWMTRQNKFTEVIGLDFIPAARRHSRVLIVRRDVTYGTITTQVQDVL